MTDQLFTWKGLVVGAMILLGAVALGIAFREGTLGNVASVVGLAVSVFGFVVTIWTVLDARQQIKEAGDRAEKAIAQAREEARRAVAGIAAQLLAADCAALRSGVEDLRQAAQDAQWPRAVYRCQECRTVAYRLAHAHQLTEEETSKLREAADDLLLIRRFVEKYRLAGQAGRLKDRQVQSLDNAIERVNQMSKWQAASLKNKDLRRGTPPLIHTLIGLLARIQARLHHEPLRPTEDPAENQ